jgi:hypothetical protein
MEVNLLILGCLFILTLFTVGESITKHFGINKWVAVLIVGTLIGVMFVAPINVGGVELYLDRFVFPGFICVLTLFGIKRPSRFILAFLFCVLGSILYLMSGLESNFFGVLQPVYALSAVLGAFIALVASNLPETVCALFFGIHAGSAMFHLTKYESLENMFVSPSLFSAVLIGFLSATLVLFVKQKIALHKHEQQLEKLL